MKVLILANNDIGLYNFRLELLERLLKEKHEVYISLPYGAKVDKLKELGCKYIETNINRHGINPVEDIKLIKLYKRIIKQISPEIIFGYTIKPNIYGAIAARKNNVPFVANITGLGTAVEKAGILQKVTVILYKFAFKRIQKVFFQNKDNMQFFIDNKIAIGKHDLLPGSGVNVEKFSYVEYPKSEIIKFAFISRIMKEKGIDQYLEMAEVIKRKYPNTEFHICGFCEEDYEERLKDLQDEGIIIYHGMENDIVYFLKDIHCVVHPTYYPEGMSNVLLEACATGRPIITTDRSGCKEIVDDAVNGYVVKQQDCQDLIEKVEKFVKLDYYYKNNLGRNARKKVEKNFNRNIVIEKYIKEVERAGREAYNEKKI